MLDIKIEKATNLKAKTPDDQLGFGRIFTDHMFIMDYDAGQGWHDARIVPYGPISLDPSSVVFHYAQECFEGLKAYPAVPIPMSTGYRFVRIIAQNLEIMIARR